MFVVNLLIATADPRATGRFMYGRPDPDYQNYLIGFEGGVAIGVVAVWAFAYFRGIRPGIALREARERNERRRNSIKFAESRCDEGRARLAELRRAAHALRATLIDRLTGG